MLASHRILPLTHSRSILYSGTRVCTVCSIETTTNPLTCTVAMFTIHTHRLSAAKPTGPKQAAVQFDSVSVCISFPSRPVVCDQTHASIADISPSSSRSQVSREYPRAPAIRVPILRAQRATYSGAGQQWLFTFCGTLRSPLRATLFSQNHTSHCRKVAAQTDWIRTRNRELCCPAGYTGFKCPQRWNQPTDPHSAHKYS